MRSIIFGFLVFLQLIGATAWAGKKRDQIAFWDFELTSTEAMNEFLEVRERFNHAIQNHLDADQIFYWALKESEAAGRLVGKLVLEIQQLEALRLQLQWGSHSAYLLGTEWSYESVTQNLEDFNEGLRKTLLHHRALHLSLFALAGQKRMQEGKQRQELIESVQAQVDRRAREEAERAKKQQESQWAAVMRWLRGKPGAQESSALPLVDHERLLSAPVIDVNPIVLPQSQGTLAIPPEFVDQLIEAYWLGLSAKVGHLLGKATETSQKVHQLLLFTRRALEAGNLSQLDGTDVKQSCVAALAAKKRN